MSSNSEWNQYPGFRKSTFSGGSETCVDVNVVAHPDLVGIRDTKDNGQGQVLVIARPAFAAFIDAVKAGEIA